jgi:hypothetical protein
MSDTNDTPEADFDKEAFIEQLKSDPSFRDEVRKALGSKPDSTRRSLLKGAGTVLGVGALAGGANTVAADPEGTVGTSADPVSVVHSDKITMSGSNRDIHSVGTIDGSVGDFSGLSVGSGTSQVKVTSAGDIQNAKTVGITQGLSMGGTISLGNNDIAGGGTVTGSIGNFSSLSMNGGKIGSVGGISMKSNDITNAGTVDASTVSANSVAADSAQFSGLDMAGNAITSAGGLDLTDNEGGNNYDITNAGNVNAINVAANNAQFSSLSMGGDVDLSTGGTGGPHNIQDANTITASTVSANSVAANNAQFSGLSMGGAINMSATGGLQNVQSAGKVTASGVAVTGSVGMNANTISNVGTLDMGGALDMAGNNIDSVAQISPPTNSAVGIDSGLSLGGALQLNSGASSGFDIVSAGTIGASALTMNGSVAAGGNNVNNVGTISATTGQFGGVSMGGNIQMNSGTNSGLDIVSAGTINASGVAVNGSVGMNANTISNVGTLDMGGALNMDGNNIDSVAQISPPTNSAVGIDSGLSLGGALQLNSGASSGFDIVSAGTIGASALTIHNSVAMGSNNVNNAGTVNATTFSGGTVTADTEINAISGAVYKVSGTQVVGPREQGVASVVDNTGGSADNNLSTVGNTSTADASTTINNNFADIAAELNNIVTALSNHGLTTSS